MEQTKMQQCTNTKSASTYPHQPARPLSRWTSIFSTSREGLFGTGSPSLARWSGRRKANRRRGSTDQRCFPRRLLEGSIRCNQRKWNTWNAKKVKDVEVKVIESWKKVNSEQWTVNERERKWQNVKDSQSHATQFRRYSPHRMKTLSYE